MQKILLATLLILCSCCSPHTIPQSPMPPQIIPTSPGPEDMLLDTSSTSPRLIISCGDFFHTNKPTRAGGIYYYNISKDIVGEFHRIGIPGDIQFFPHGIAKHPKKNMLYVIIHDRSGIETGNNGIIIFNIEGDQLVFQEVIRDSYYLATPNDLTVTEDGSIYVTNSGGFKPKQLLERIFVRKPFISHYNPNTKTFSKARKTWFGNGIHAIGNKIYYVDSIWKRIREMEIQKDGSLSLVRKIKVARQLDNISFVDGKLYISSHNSLKQLRKAQTDSTVKPPSSVYEVDLTKGKSKRIYDVKDGKPISAVSTAFVYDGHLYMSQIFDNFIVKVKYPE